MTEYLYIAIILFGYLTGYLVSLYSLAVYIDPDEVDSLLPKITRARREFVKKLASDPRAFTQMAVVYKSFVLVLLTACAIAIMRSSIAEGNALRPFLTVFGALFIWLSYILFVEYLPRRSSRRAISMRMASHLWIISGIYTLFFPIVTLYRRALRGGPLDKPITDDDKEEIVERAIETLADDAGIGETIVEEDEKEMIGQIFQLDQTVVREIMIPRVDICGIDKSMNFDDIRRLIHETGYSRYPVFEESIDKIVGLIYVKDLFNRMPKRGEAFSIDKYIRPPFLVPESKVIGKLLREFKVKRMHIAIVMDEYGGVSGIVTLEDIIEEIFGEIHDEHDQARDDVRRIGEGNYIVSANLLVEKLQDYLQTDHDQGDYDTVGGLIYDLVGSVPPEGKTVQWNDVEFEIDKVDGQRIVQVKVRH